MNEIGWQYLDHKLTKREADGKDSMVFLCGRQLTSRTVSKERNRHQTLSLRTMISDG